MGVVGVEGAVMDWFGQGKSEGNETLLVGDAGIMLDTEV